MTSVKLPLRSGLKMLKKISAKKSLYYKQVNYTSRWNMSFHIGLFQKSRMLSKYKCEAGVLGMGNMKP